MKRDSNIELLRIVAMLLVLFVHANYLSLGAVEPNDITNSPIDSFFKALLEQLCTICVNVFVLISGWFGIKSSIKGAISLLFQVFFFHILIIIAAICIGETITLHTIIDCFYFGSPYWFVTSYLVLYAISPILNSFIETASPRLYLSVLCAFFFVEFALGWATDLASFKSGYSAISFVGLYLLANFIRTHSKRLLNLGICQNFLLYFICSIVPIAIFFLTKHDFNMIAYSSPFVISASIFFFLAFNKMTISSTAVNYLACSSFSIYLVHQHPVGCRHFIDLMSSTFEKVGGYWYILFVLIFALVFGLLCIMLDKVRIRIWHFICKIFLDKAISNYKKLIDKIYLRLGY